MAGRGDTLATQEEDSVQAGVEICESPLPGARGKFGRSRGASGTDLRQTSPARRTASVIASGGVLTGLQGSDDGRRTSGPAAGKAGKGVADPPFMAGSRHRDLKPVNRVIDGHRRHVCEAQAAGVTPKASAARC
jgi:hypothetical protein